MRLIKSNNKKLKKKSLPYSVDEMNKARSFSKKMMKEFNKLSGVYGVSAVQFGHLKQMFIMRYRGVKRLVINPCIVHKSTETNIQEESCLSYPGKIKKVKCHNVIVVEYLDKKGNVIKEKLSGMEARIFQHEYNHLIGKPNLR